MNYLYGERRLQAPLASFRAKAVFFFIKKIVKKTAYLECVLRTWLKNFLL